MWRERNERGVEGDPPCHTCRVEPMPENEAAWKIFNINRYQLIVAGMDGQILDINHLTVYESMRLYKIKNRPRCFEKVLILSRWWTKKLNDKKGG